MDIVYTYLQNFPELYLHALCPQSQFYFIDKRQFQFNKQSNLQIKQNLTTKIKKNRIYFETI